MKPAPCSILNGGAVKNSCISQSGKERIIGILKEREFFGTGCITGFTRRRMTAVAITDCVVLQIENPLMIDIVYRDLRVAEMFITFLVDQTRYYEEALVDHLLHSSEERLARTLCASPVSAAKVTISPCCFPRSARRH